MKKWLYISWLIISTNTFAFSPLPQLVAGGVSTWTNSGLMAEGLYVGGSIANPVILTVVGSGVIGLGAAKLMNNFWYSNCEQQLACEVAKLNTYAGAVVGTVVTTVLTGVISGVVGTTVLISVPIVTAAVAGGVSYYWWFEND